MSDNGGLSDMIRKPRHAGPVICCSWVDSPEKCDPGVGFSRFIGGPASRFISGLSARARLQPAARRERRPSIAREPAGGDPLAARRRLAIRDTPGSGARAAGIRSGGAAPAEGSSAPNAASRADLEAAPRAGLEMRQAPKRRREVARPDRRRLQRRQGSQCAIRRGAARVGTARRWRAGLRSGIATRFHRSTA